MYTLSTPIVSTPDLRIAISSIPRPIETGYGPDNAGTVADRAVAAIARSGAAPIVLPVTDPRLAPAQLDGVDGLILSGGHDLAIPTGDLAEEDPGRWIDPARDAHELALWRVAADLGLPVLGICRGAQLVNHARGGETIAHIDGHDAGEDYERATHEVVVRPSTRLAAICGDAPFPVNTIHHQVVGSTGEGLRVAATDASGIVEAIEAIEGSDWFVGVQWHPELMGAARAGQGLFDALAAAADRRR